MPAYLPYPTGAFPGAMGPAGLLGPGALLGAGHAAAAAAAAGGGVSGGYGGGGYPAAAPPFPHQPHPHQRGGGMQQQQHYGGGGHHHGGGKRGRGGHAHHHQQQQQAHAPFYPGQPYLMAYPPNTPGSVGSTPLSSTPPSSVGMGVGGYRGVGQGQGQVGAPQPYSAHFGPGGPNTFMPNPYGAFTPQALAYQMANMQMSGAGGSAAAAAAAAAAASAPSMGPTSYMMPPQAGASASSSSQPTPQSSGDPGISLPLPPIPTPVSAPPFQQLLTTHPLPPSSQPYYSVDVECVATGSGHNDRTMAHVSIVSAHGQVILNVYIKPDVPVFSYLTALTGLTEAQVSAGMSKEEALALLRQRLPKNALLVGQNVLKDVQWLELVEGVDFGGMLDLAGLFSVKHPTYHTMTRFSLAHQAKALLAIEQNEQHHPAIDALLSVQLYQLYTLLQQHPEEMERAKSLLMQLEPEPAFNRRNPTYDGVCMGNKKLCKCGQAWFF